MEETITKKEKDQLNFIAYALNPVQRMWDDLTPEARKELKRAAKKCNTTNCWYSTYHAAKWILSQE
jgi:hypothetical protein